MAFRRLWSESNYQMRYCDLSDFSGYMTGKVNTLCSCVLLSTPNSPHLLKQTDRYHGHTTLGLYNTVRIDCQWQVASFVCVTQFIFYVFSRERHICIGLVCHSCVSSRSRLLSRVIQITLSWKLAALINSRRIYNPSSDSRFHDNLRRLK